MNEATKPKRKYRIITPHEIAKFKALSAALGNGTVAVRELTPDIVNQPDRAWRIKSKPDTVNTYKFIDDTLQQIGVNAINRLGELVLSTNESIAQKSTHYAIDQIRGQAVRRQELATRDLTLEAILKGK